MKTIGDVVSELFTKYERRYHDAELAAVATEVELDDLLREQVATKRAALQRLRMLARKAA
ncbi:MAG TPA: hypothetical protein VGF94_00145 [Kofleriaceae bacterium]|jgi:hypothetical protein